MLSAEEFEEGGGEGGVLGTGLALGPVNTVPQPHHHQLTQVDSLEDGTDSGPAQMRRYNVGYGASVWCRVTEVCELK